LLPINKSGYLVEARTRKMTAAHSASLRKFTDLAFDESAEMRWQESRPTEAEDSDVGAVKETDSEK